MKKSHWFERIQLTLLDFRSIKKQFQWNKWISEYLFLFLSFKGPHQAIFCEITTVRLISHGKHNNQVIVRLRKADENDLDIVTLSCLD